MRRLVVDGAEQARDLCLTPARDVLLERFGHRVLLGAAPPDSDGFLDERRVQVETGSTRYSMRRWLADSIIGSSPDGP